MLQTIIGMLTRAILLYTYGLLISRFNKKLLGIRTPFNFVIFIILGSIFAAAILHGQHFVPIIIVVTCLMLINAGLAFLAFKFPALERLIKGPPVYLVKNGAIEWDAMKEHLITRSELLNELQTQLQTRDMSAVRSARLASDGTINFTLKD